MDSQSKEYLKKILEKDPGELNPDEIGFLKARRSYLKKSQLDEYASILNQTSEKAETVKQHANKPRKTNS